MKKTRKELLEEIHDLEEEVNHLYTVLESEETH